MAFGWLANHLPNSVESQNMTCFIIQIYADIKTL